MRDDISKLPLPKSAKRYARMKASDLDGHWSKKLDMHFDAIASITNQSKAGFHNRDAAGPVQHSMNGIGEASKVALQKAAQAWCRPIASRKEMDVDLATAFAEIIDEIRALGPKAFKGLGEGIVEVMLDDEEGVRAAAVMTHKGNVYTGRGHWEACMKANMAGEPWSQEDLGFVTTKGRFVDRDEAEMIGARMGQLQKYREDPDMVHSKEFIKYL
jgi:hypothetical protein